MSVLIKGMEMPNTCQICRTARFDRIIDCEVFDRLSIGEQMYKRSASCPLVEVPPHGDLIDRDALSNDGWTLHKEVMVMGGFAIHELPLINPTIPVIIEAEE